MSADSIGAWQRVPRNWGPWAVLAIVLVQAVRIFTTFETGADLEFPAVERPTFSPRPPAAYRLAEPGDTLDRIALYASSASAVLAGLGWFLSRRAGLGDGFWPVGLALAVGFGYDGATPWPTFDGWHGLNWRALADPNAPPGLRWLLGLGAAGLLIWSVGWALKVRDRWGSLLRSGRRLGTLALFTFAIAGMTYRTIGWPDVEPIGYWPRVAGALGAIAFGLVLLKALPIQTAASMVKTSTRRRIESAGLAGAGVLATAVLIAGGLGLVRYHRPIARLRTIVPGRIYLSGMPTKRGLEIAQDRHQFKTIINVFNEDGPQRSPLLSEELEFAREHGITYVGNPSDPLQADAFLDETLRIAQDPDAWPILVHCHGSMDRSPAWMGIYRFVVEGRPLSEVFREIEGHRGLRPKASVTLLYNRVLEPRAPEHYRDDPTARLLNRLAAGTVDPFDATVREALQAAEIARDEPNAGRRPNSDTPNPGRLR